APATTEVYTLSLHDALPILDPAKVVLSKGSLAPIRGAIERMEQQRIKVSLYSEEDLPDGRSDDEVILYAYDPVNRMVWRNDETRSEEHTSELQSRENLVCRL